MKHLSKIVSFRQKRMRESKAGLVMNALNDFESVDVEKLTEFLLSCDSNKHIYVC